MNYPELSKPLYHGSDAAVSVIDLSMGAPRKDFGRGFYTTNDRRQAEKFAKVKASRSIAQIGYVSVFEFQNAKGLVVQKFSSSDKGWFDFVLQNRGYDSFGAADTIPSSDIIIGPVANDAVGVVLNLFVSGTYGDPKTTEAKETAIKLLLTQKLHNQVFFGTELAISRLAFKEVYDVYLD